MPTLDSIKLTYNLKDKSERSFELTEHLELRLPDGRFIVIPKGFKTDLISVPSWLWSILKPFDKALIADIVHDYLWVNRVSEIARFDGNIYMARKYADDTRLKMRKQLASEKWFKNYVTHLFLRIFGGLYYARQLKIPKK